MGLQSSIFHRKDHAHALSVIDIIVETPDFPSIAKCPHCGETSLNIYEDTAKTDLWLTCLNCSAQGNIITFAEAYWKIDTLATMEKFRELGVNTRTFSAEIVNYNVKYAKIGRSGDWFWQQAASQLWTHGNDLLLLKFRDFGLSPEIPCQGLAGVATTEQVAELCRNIIPAYPRKLRSNVPVLVLPYCNLPKQHSGFLLIQYLEEFETRRFFLPLYGVSFPDTANTKEAGYYLLNEAVSATHQAVRDAVFVVDDPQWVLKAQTIQLRHGDKFLPICASYSGREAESMGRDFPYITQSRKFFYSARITPQLITQAANARGYICALRADGLPKSTQPAKTIKTLGQMYRAAVTWQKTLTHIFENTSDIYSKSFVTKLRIPTEKLRAFFANNPVASAEVVEQIMAKTPPIYFSSECATQYSTSVLIKDDGWYTSRNSLITNCLPVIEKIVHTDDTRYYIGHVKKHGKKVAFQERAKKIERVGLLAYAERLMAVHNEHVLFMPAWNSRSHLTAMQLRAPEIVHIRNQPGWDDELKEFYCGPYAINTDGVVRAIPHTDLYQPIISLPEPGTYPPPSLHKLLAITPEVAGIWVALSATLANMLAPVFQQPQQSIAIVNDLFLSAREMLKSFGIKHKEVRTLEQKITKVFANKVINATWPTILSARAATDKFAGLAFVKHPNTAGIVRIVPGTIPTALSYGWQVLNAPAVTPGLDYGAIPYVIASYIQHAIMNRVKFFRIGEQNLTKAVMSDLNNWLAETYGSTFNLAQADKYIITPGEETAYLMREVNNAILAGEIDVLPVPRKQRQENNYIVRDNATWWLNRRAIDVYLKQISGLTPNWIGIADCFSQAGLLRGEKTINKMTGLLVDREWCDQFWTNYTAAANKDIG